MVSATHPAGHRCAPGNRRRKTGQRGDHRLWRGVGWHLRPAGEPAAQPQSHRQRLRAVTGDHRGGTRRGRNAMAIWQDLVDTCDFAGGYQSARRFVRKPTPAPRRKPAWSSRLPSARNARSIMAKADSSRPGHREVPAHPAVRDDPGLQPQIGSAEKHPAGGIRGTAGRATAFGCKAFSLAQQLRFQRRFPRSCRAYSTMARFQSSRSLAERYCWFSCVTMSPVRR